MPLTLPDKETRAATATLGVLDEADWPQLWTWVDGNRKAQVDDFGPTTWDQFALEMDRRMARGERLYRVSVDGVFCGAIGYAPVSPVAGMLHGVTMAPAYQGRGIAGVALTSLLRGLAAEGVRKVSASYFADNAAIRSCLKGVGFVDEGFLQDQTQRDGLPLSMWLTAKMLRS